MGQEFLKLAEALAAKFGGSDVLAEQFGIEPGDKTVYKSAVIPDKANRRVNINLASDFALEADPPFEWRAELTFYDPDSHYLLLPDGKFVRTERKDFFDVSVDEFQRIAAELQSFL